MYLIYLKQDDVSSPHKAFTKAQESNFMAELVAPFQTLIKSGYAIILLFQKIVCHLFSNILNFILKKHVSYKISDVCVPNIVWPHYQILYFVFRTISPSLFSKLSSLFVENTVALLCGLRSFPTRNLFSGIQLRTLCPHCILMSWIYFATKRKNILFCILLRRMVGTHYILVNLSE